MIRLLVSDLSLLVSILGLARSPTISAQGMIAAHMRFQYLGSRGAQRKSRSTKSGTTKFQYLGSRGAQLLDEIARIFDASVSILGLARSPTVVIPVTV